MSIPYSQTQPYIPQTDAAFRDWLLNFSTLISLDPARYCLDVADAGVIAGHYVAFNNAYALVQSRATRTPITLAQKDALRASALSSARVYAQMIKADPGVNNEDKAAVGIHLDDPTPSPVPAPASAPVLMIVGAANGVHQLRYSDENTPKSRGERGGGLRMQLNTTVGAAAAIDAEASSFVGLYTEQPVMVSLSAADAGRIATYFARWVAGDGVFGPWSLPQSMLITCGEDAPDAGERQERACHIDHPETTDDLRTAA